MDRTRSCTRVVRTAVLGVLMMLLAPESVGADTLEAVRDRGHLRCGVNAEPVPGFVMLDERGDASGFDVDYCRAVAAAVLADATAVSFVPLGTADRFAALERGDIDVLARATTWTATRDVAKPIDFVAVTYFDGQGFMVRGDLGVRSAFELDGVRVCVLARTTSALNLEDFFRTNSMALDAVVVDGASLTTAYVEGRCEAMTSDLSRLAAERSGFDEPEDHVILPDVISKEPLALAVRDDDPRWRDIVRWSHFALLAAEEVGVGRDGLEAMRASARPAVRHLFDDEPTRAALGLDPGWVVRIVGAVGHYGELFDRNIGTDSALGLPRGLNALWRDGGLHYAMPFR